MGMIEKQIVEAIQNAPRGCYQRALIDGRENWSGSALRAEGKRMGSPYQASQDKLLSRINETLPDGVMAVRKLVKDVDSPRWYTDLVIYFPSGISALWDGKNLRF